MVYGVTVIATVEYQCILSDEDSKKVDELVRQSEEDPNNPFSYTVAEAIQILYDRGEISLYDNSTESNFWTKSIYGASILS